MLLHSLNRVVVYVFSTAVFAFICFGQATPGDANSGVQIEFPDGGRLRIENQFGSVAVESWKEKFIDIASSEDTTATKARSVVIENRDQRTVIRVLRRPGLPVAQIDLSIKLPETARVEIVTGSGRISLRGLPASAVIRSVSGDATVEFLDTANADIIARSTKGSVKSELPQLVSENGHVLQARLGNGAQTLRVNSEAGSISLLDESRNAISSRPAR